MRFEAFSFGSIRIDGVTHPYDVVIDRGQIRKRKKKPSKQFRDAFGHTPLSVEEEPVSSGNHYRVTGEVARDRHRPVECGILRERARDVNRPFGRGRLFFHAVQALDGRENDGAEPDRLPDVRTTFVMLSAMIGRCLRQARYKDIDFCQAGTEISALFCFFGSC